jgi:hypothetical protein
MRRHGCGFGVGRVSGFLALSPLSLVLLMVWWMCCTCFGASQLSIVFPMLWWEWLACFSAIDGVSGVVGVCWELEDSSGGFTPPEARVCFSDEAPR